MQGRDTGKTTAEAITNNIVRNPIPIYEIEQYEIHTQTYRVEASSDAEALKMLFDGETDAEDNGLDYIEVFEDMGLPAEEHRELAVARRFSG